MANGPDRANILGSVMAGGMARRFGSDKALASLHGRTLIDTTADALSRQVDEIVICGRTHGNRSCLEDQPSPGLGPLGGLLAALRRAQACGFQAVVTVGCDMPILPVDLVARLAASGQPAVDSNLPVIGYWPTRLADRLEAFLAAPGRHAMRDWATVVDALPITASSRIPNINRPSDLDRLARTLLDLRPPRVTFFDALRIVRASVRIVEPVRLPLEDCLRHIVASDVAAKLDCPRFDVSAMDGFAIAAAQVAAADKASAVHLTVARCADAGRSVSASATRGACRISTGARVPEDCDTVIPIEQATLARVGAETLLTIDRPWVAGSNVRKQGEDATAGEQVAARGMMVTPSIIGALAAYGVAALEVRQPPTVFLIPTGDELDLPTAGSDRIADSNTPMLRAMARSLGAKVRALRPVADTLDAVVSAIGDACRLDPRAILVSTGGVSVGSRDFVLEALRCLDAKICFHGVDMRPGKPTLFATLPGGQIFFGLPGNPVAAFLGFRFFVGAALGTITGRADEVPIVLETVVPEGRVGTTVFLKAKRHYTKAGLFSVEVLPGQQSHMMRPMLCADSWLVIDRTQPQQKNFLFPLNFGLSN